MVGATPSGRELPYRFDIHYRKKEAFLGLIDNRFLGGF